jgi:hypothetical protein
MYFDCSPYEDGETYLAADTSIKCEGPEAGPYFDSLGYVSFMSILFPLGIPLYYLVALLKVRQSLNTPLSIILKDRDYVTTFALAGHRFVEEGASLMEARDAMKKGWVRRNPKLAASLEGKDYKVNPYRRILTFVHPYRRILTFPVAFVFPLSAFCTTSDPTPGTV